MAKWTIFEDLEDELAHHKRRSVALWHFVRAIGLFQKDVKHLKKETRRLHEGGAQLQTAYLSALDEASEAAGDAAYWKEFATTAAASAVAGRGAGLGPMPAPPDMRRGGPSVGEGAAAAGGEVEGGSSGSRSVAGTQESHLAAPVARAISSPPRLCSDAFSAAGTNTSPSRRLAGTSADLAPGSPSRLRPWEKAVEQKPQESFQDLREALRAAAAEAAVKVAVGVRSSAAAWRGRSEEDRRQEGVRAPLASERQRTRSSCSTPEVLGSPRRPAAPAAASWLSPAALPPALPTTVPLAPAPPATTVPLVPAPSGAGPAALAAAVATAVVLPKASPPAIDEAGAPLNTDIVAPRTPCSAANEEFSETRALTPNRLRNGDGYPAMRRALFPSRSSPLLPGAKALLVGCGSPRPVGGLLGLGALLPTPARSPQRCPPAATRSANGGGSGATPFAATAGASAAAASAAGEAAATGSGLRLGQRA